MNRRKSERPQNNTDSGDESQYNWKLRSRMRWVNGMDDGKEPELTRKYEKICPRAPYSLLCTHLVHSVTGTRGDGKKRKKIGEGVNKETMYENFNELSTTQRQSSPPPTFHLNTTHLIHRWAVASFSRLSVFPPPFGTCSFKETWPMVCYFWSKPR